jgi:glycosyltransferase involved in cell wall biosynthesis
VVHIHGTFSHLTAAAAASARRHRVPYILRPAGSLDGLCLQRGSRRLKRLFTKVYLQRDLRGAAYLQATSSSEARELRVWRDAEEIRVIPHGVHVGAIEKRSGGEILQSAFPQLRGRTVVLFMGRLHAIKRVEVLVQAVARLRSNRPDLALLIAGHDAGHMPALMDAVQSAGIEESVVFAGFLQGERKQAALAGADVFALPSAHENFGVAVVEAMAHGTPVLVAPGVASHSYVDESGGGVTAAGTVEGFARGLTEILGKDRDEMGRRGRRFVEDNLSWPAIVRQLDQLYEDALRRVSRSPAGTSC